MTSPRTLLLSIAATACGFILTLVGVAGPAPIAPTPAVGAPTVPGLVSAVTQDASGFDPARFAITLDPAASDSASLDATDRAGGSAPLRGRARRPYPHGSLW